MALKLSGMAAKNFALFVYAVLPLILECAAEKYKTCSIKESDHLTIKIKALFQEHSNDEELNRELFEQTVKQVILQPDGSIKFQLLNGKIV